MKEILNEIENDIIDIKTKSFQVAFNDTLGISYSGGKLIRFDKVESNIHFSPILMAARVFTGFRTANPKRNASLWEKTDNHNIKNIDVDVYGGTAK